jgi:hypothetical protein
MSHPSTAAAKVFHHPSPLPAVAWQGMCNFDGDNTPSPPHMVHGGSMMGMRHYESGTSMWSCLGGANAQPRIGDVVEALHR